MSGGHYNYMYSRIEDTYVGEMYDSQLNEMMKDLVDLLHDLEWWQSCDYSEETYRESVNKFKKKWFRQTKIDVQKQIESEFERTKNELLKEFEYLKDEREEKKVKLAKMKYRTVGGDLKVNTYTTTISKKIVAESGIDPEKEIIVKAEKGKIIIEQK